MKFDVKTKIAEILSHTMNNVYVRSRKSVSVSGNAVENRWFSVIDFWIFSIQYIYIYREIYLYLETESGSDRVSKRAPKPLIKHTCLKDIRYFWYSSLSLSLFLSLSRSLLYCLRMWRSMNKCSNIHFCPLLSVSIIFFFWFRLLYITVSA